MADSTKPIWLLDIDGVLNALTDRDTLEHPHWTDLVKKPVRTSFDVEYDLVMSTTVVNFVKDQAAAGTDIQWATTWQSDANMFVAPAFGLPVLPVGAEALGMSDYHYKERAALAAIDAGRPLIWTDDDAIRRVVRMEIEESDVPHLLIEPDPRLGLTPAHLDAIAAFIADHTNV